MPPFGTARKMGQTMTALGSLTRRLKALFHDRSGLALIEFAYSLPFLTIVGMGATELTNYAWVKLQVSQIALNTADHASRLGENGVLQDIKIYESDINDLFTGADLESGSLDLAANGRVILSSLTRNDDDGQWIQWQRCTGALDHDSSYGEEGDGETGTSFTGMGISGKEIKASADTAVMFVEVAYTYQPLFTDAWVPGPMELVEFAAFNVRDDRDLTQIYTVSGVTASTCS